MWTDIHSKILIANSTYLVHINFSGLNRYPEILKQMTSEEINALGVFKRKNVRKMYGPMQEEECRDSEPIRRYRIFYKE
jgi:hypothetical protein